LSRIDDVLEKTRLAFKLWLETDEGYVFGPGVYNLLKMVKKTGTLKEASEKLEMSYRYAWGLIKKAEEALGESLIEAQKGGKSGGGSTNLTELGEQFVEDFSDFINMISGIVQNESSGLYVSNFIGIVEKIDKVNDFVKISFSAQDPISLTFLSNTNGNQLSIGDRVGIEINYYGVNIT
jgi:molybdate transport repressor ModE-like protein